MECVANELHIRKQQRAQAKLHMQVNFLLDFSFYQDPQQKRKRFAWIQNLQHSKL